MLSSSLDERVGIFVDLDNRWTKPKVQWLLILYLVLLVSSKYNTNIPSFFKYVSHLKPVLSNSYYLHLFQLYRAFELLQPSVMSFLSNSRWQNRKERQNRSTTTEILSTKLNVTSCVSEWHLSNYREAELLEIYMLCTY